MSERLESGGVLTGAFAKEIGNSYCLNLSHCYKA